MGLCQTELDGVLWGLGHLQCLAPGYMGPQIRPVPQKTSDCLGQPQTGYLQGFPIRA